MIEQLTEMGFGCFAIRPRRGGWDHETPWFEEYSAMISAAVRECGADLVLDLDVPFYDSPRRREPHSISSIDPQERQEACARLKAWIQRSELLNPSVISFSSGSLGVAERAPSDERATVSVEEEGVLERLAEAVEPLSRLATDCGIRLALRPVAGHAIATVAHFERFGQWLGSETELGLAADVGEMLLAGEFPIGARLARLQHRLACVYLCEPDLDRKCDQRFGYGDIDLSRVWDVMTESGYAGPAIFRACGHDHLGFEIAKEAIALTQA
ncbi:MAG: TIM barrel protein [Planctomycetota bacterium]